MTEYSLVLGIMEKSGSFGIPSSKIKVADIFVSHLIEPSNFFRSVRAIFDRDRENYKKIFTLSGAHCTSYKQTLIFSTRNYITNWTADFELTDLEKAINKKEDLFMLMGPCDRFYMYYTYRNVWNRVAVLSHDHFKRVHLIHQSELKYTKEFQ